MTGLRTFGGRPAPDGIAADLRTIMLLRSEVREKYFDLLAPNLAAELGQDEAAYTMKWLQNHNVDPYASAPSVKACRTLFREAARNDVSADVFADDVASLVAEEPELVTTLCAWFDKAQPLLRKEIVVHTIARHGNLAKAIDWRVDKITTSKRGKNINTAVAVLSFQYREGSSDKTVTLQFLPELLKELQDACAEILA